jgi:homoserine O-succinyltransferase
MNFSENKIIRIAILDLYEGVANEGMRCIREIIQSWSLKNNIQILVEEFEVRIKKEIPSIHFDLFISSGGPGSPLDSDNTEWEKLFFNWIRSIEEFNKLQTKENQKQIFFICHSFQLACKYYEIGNICKRKSTAFGVFPIHMLSQATDEIIFEGLKDPFYAVDSRDYQVIEPNHSHIQNIGAKILAIEKSRPHVPFERAVMAVRFNDNFVGTQIHPEADAIGMAMYLQRPDKKETIIKNHGYEKWENMLTHLKDPDKIEFTNATILPNFLNQAILCLS